MADDQPLEFFYDAGSCSLAVRIVLEECGFPYQERRVTARDADRDTLRPDWLVRNPKGRVPALLPVAGRAGGERGLLTEVPAILTYLARLRPDLDLVPVDPAREARTLEWLNYLSGWVHSVCFAQLWRPARFVDDPASFASVRKKGLANLLDAFAAIEAIFADDRAWAVPDRFTIADAFLLVFYRWGGVVDVDMTRYEGWTASTRNACRRASVMASFAKDGLPSL
jgi:glutathione S-transferase